ncbi:C2H2-type domain-containing protein [Aphelenchoides fujianensis]|nr:C2H2-type domain-containing protein [Aphelenchoides fujianensis]
MLHDSSEYVDLPDWAIIDEISIPLLLAGIGEYDTLQSSLPSVVLSKCEKIDEEWTEKRLLKMFRLAQLQLQYILHSQHELVRKLSLEQEKYRKVYKENGHFKRNITSSPNTTRELFRCEECNKIFLHGSFLIEHIERKHGHHEPPPPPQFRISSVAGNSGVQPQHSPKLLSSASSNTSIWR